jgi:hypothetical protein
MELVEHSSHNSEYMLSSHLIDSFILDVAPLNLAEHRDEAGNKGLNHGCLSLV